MTKIKSMVKIVAVSVMSAIVGISFNGCGFFKSTGNQALASLGSVAEQGVSNALSSTDDKIKDISNTKAKETQKEVVVDNIKREKCESNEIKRGSVVRESGECKDGIKEGLWKYYDDSGYIVQKEVTYKKGVLDGVSKEYDKDENLIYERQYKDGKLHGTSISYDKKELKDYFTKITRDFVYDNDKPRIERFYIGNNIAIFIQRHTEGNVEIERFYNISEQTAKELEKTLLPKLNAKYDKAIKNADKKNKQILKCGEAMNEVNKYNEGKTRIQPSAQTIKTAKECEASMTAEDAVVGIAMSLYGPRMGTLKIKEQIKKEFNDALKDELQKSNKFSDDKKVLAYIGDKYPYYEAIKTENLSIQTEEQKTQFYDCVGYCSNIGTINHNAKNTQESCVAEGSGNCRAFSRQFKELIDKSAFKNTIYNLLPKPRKQ